jgi:putative endonuclease
MSTHHRRQGFPQVTYPRRHHPERGVSRVKAFARSTRNSMRKPKHFHVYIMTNNQRAHVLYAGITGDLPRRVFEHKHKLTPGFTSRYNLTRLVYCECSVTQATQSKEKKKLKAGYGARKSS